MTAKNRKKQSAPPAARKRLTAPVPMPAAPEAITFQAALVECAEAPVAKRSVKRHTSKPQPVAPAPQSVPAEVAALPEPQAATVLVRAWSWLQVKYASLAKRPPLAAEPQQLATKPQAALTDGAKKQAKPRRRATSLARAKSASSSMTAPNAMARAFSWLQTKYTVTTTKRLRVSETVSLGEKRFVALVSVEGREFLIGGGSSGVSMLAHLTPGHDATHGSQIGGIAQ